MADTFTNRQTGESFDGFCTLTKRGGKTQVRTGESQGKYINLADYDVTWNHKGRKNKVFIFRVTDAIELACVTEAFEKALVAIANQGPLFIVIEIDTPGGRVDLTKRMCETILKVDNCTTIAFITGGEYGGALSGGAVLALACNRIFMAEESTIGAATMITVSDGKMKSLRDTYGEEVGEKLTSAWRAYMRSVAEANGRNGLIASAMVDRQVEVVEVQDGNNKRFFIDPKDRKKDDKVIKRLSKRGSLLTLTSEEAYDCYIADKIISIRKQLLEIMNADNADVVVDVHCDRAKMAFEKVKADYEKSMEEIHLQIERLNLTDSKNEAYTLLRKIRREIKTLIRLAKKNEDLHVAPQEWKKTLNSVEAVYEKVKKAGPD